jgi:RNA-dependent RNA polymerase
MQETMGPIIANHRERFRNACIKVAGSREPNVLYPFIAAAYRVTWEAVQITIHEANGLVTGDQSMPFISFPWIFEQELGRIAKLEQDYQLDSFPEVPVCVGEDEVDDEIEYERLLGLGVFAPKLEEVEGEELSVEESDPMLQKEEEIALQKGEEFVRHKGEETVRQGEEEIIEEMVELEEVETSMEVLEKLLGDS